MAVNVLRYDRTLIPMVARLLGLRVRIPSRVWMCLSCKCCVLSRTRFSVGLITRPEEYCRVWFVSDYDCEASTMRRLWRTGGLRHEENIVGKEKHSMAKVNPVGNLTMLNYMICRPCKLFTGRLWWSRHTNMKSRLPQYEHCFTSLIQ
jgi:hypothetical protein